MKRKTFLCILTISLLLMCACGSKDEKIDSSQEKTDSAGKSLYQHGLDIISIMDELVGNDEYRKMRGLESLDEVAEKINKGDYAEPAAVYRIDISEDSFNEIISLNGLDTDGFSEGLKEYFKKRTIKSIANMINSKYGTESIAAAGIFCAEKTFVSTEPGKNEVYVYTYESGYPIMVAFAAGEDGAVNASGNFILDDEFNVDSEEEFQEFLDKTLYFCRGEKLDI